MRKVLSRLVNSRDETRISRSRARCAWSHVSSAAMRYCVLTSNERRTSSSTRRRMPPRLAQAVEVTPRCHVRVCRCIRRRHSTHGQPARVGRRALPRPEGRRTSLKRIAFSARPGAATPRTIARWLPRPCARRSCRRRLRPVAGTPHVHVQTEPGFCSRARRTVAVDATIFARRRLPSAPSAVVSSSMAVSLQPYHRPERSRDQVQLVLHDQLGGRSPFGSASLVFGGVPFIGP